MSPLDENLNRRQFLARLGAGSLGLVALSIVPACEFIDVQVYDQGFDDHSQFITPQEDGIWYWQSGQGIPKEEAPHIDPQQWRLRCTFAEETLAQFSLADLEALAEEGEELTFFKTLRCVFSSPFGGPFTSLVANGLFTGVSLRALLEKLPLPAQAVRLHTFGADGFTSNLPL